MSGGTITAGSTSSNVTYTAGGGASLTLNVTVTKSGCSTSNSKVVNQNQGSSNKAASRSRVSSSKAASRSRVNSSKAASRSLDNRVVSQTPDTVESDQKPRRSAGFLIFVTA